MKIETSLIREGEFDDHTLWICHYNRPNMHKRAMRNLPPTKVVVRGIAKHPPKTQVYYSESYFVPFDKYGKPTTKVISPVDGCGYKSFIGNELFVFDDEESCMAEWDIQLHLHIRVLDKLIENSANHWRVEKDKLLKSLTYKY